MNYIESSIKGKRVWGTNSHMAIRYAEFKIPAAIGCGEQRFEKMLNQIKYILTADQGYLFAGLKLWLCGYVVMWLCGYVVMWLIGLFL